MMSKDSVRYNKLPVATGMMSNLKSIEELSEINASIIANPRDMIFGII